MRPCPACGGVLQLHTDADIGTTWVVQPPGAMPYLEQRRRPAVAVFCSACDYARELRKERR